MIFKNSFVQKVFLASSLFSWACASVPSPAHAASPEWPELETVQSLDVQRYLGKWYEIASIPQRFSRNCVGTTATYSLRNDGDIDVLNECRKYTLDGKYSKAHGKAWVVNPEVSPSKLKVRFFWPFSGDYWVIELGDQYEYSVVGHPSRNYFWILSRTPQMDEATLQGILSRAQAKGYDLERIQKTLQPAGTNPALEQE